jgi:hypothetical protein
VQKYNWYILKEFFHSQGFRQIINPTRDMLYFKNEVRIKFGFEKSNNISPLTAMLILKKANLGYNQLSEFVDTLSISNKESNN